MHDFRFRYNICAHSAQEGWGEMGAGLVDWATSNSPSRDKLHDNGCDKNGEEPLGQFHVIDVIVDSQNLDEREQACVESRQRQQKH